MFPIVISFESGQPLLEIDRCSLFSALKSIPQLCAQLDAADMSDERFVQISWVSLPMAYVVVSSAKRAQSVDKHFGKSFTKMRKRVGPSTVP